MVSILLGAVYAMCAILQLAEDSISMVRFTALSRSAVDTCSDTLCCSASILFEIHKDTLNDTSRIFVGLARFFLKSTKTCCETLNDISSSLGQNFSSTCQILSLFWKSFQKAPT